jgi:hypothetical protein
VKFVGMGIIMKDSKITHHHVIPRSRGGATEKQNIVMVTRIEHDRYHQIFANKTPEEILHYLVNVFWGSNTEYLKNYLEEIENN